MCSLCGNTGVENALIAVGPHFLVVFMSRIKYSIKALKNKLNKN